MTVVSAPTDAAAQARNAVVITVPELASARGGADLPVLLDVRFRPAGPSQRDSYDAGHIPGAIFVELNDDLAGEPSPAAGRRPLPSTEQVQQRIRTWGIDRHTPVVVYGDQHGGSAGRAWWVLVWAGVENVRFLDGGWEAWRDAGLEVSTVAAGPSAPTAFVARPGQLPVLDTHEVAEIAERGVLLDARGARQYRGEAELLPGERAGHIPGALSAPSTANLAEDGRLLPPNALREHYARLGVSVQSLSATDAPVGVYCGGGVGAALDVLALRSLGITVPLYVGSWGAWSSDPERPAALGSAPR